MSHLTILRSYVQTIDSLPSSLLFKKSSKNIVIFDGYPKSIFHFLILPRIQDPTLSISRLNNLQSLLSGDKATAKEVIEGLADDAKQIKKDIEDEMLNKYGFKWEVWIGFHGAPSMQHLHLHVLSSDLCSEKLKHKKHYNSFHPKLGFFLHLDELVSWFDAESSYFASKVTALKPSNYEPLLKEALVCFRCNSGFKNIPALKHHLQEEWEKLERRAEQANRRKRKLSGALVPSEASNSASVDHGDQPSDEAPQSHEKPSRMEETTNSALP